MDAPDAPDRDEGLRREPLAQALEVELAGADFTGAGGGGFFFTRARICPTVSEGVAPFFSQLSTRAAVSSALTGRTVTRAGRSRVLARRQRACLTDKASTPLGVKSCRP